MMAVVLFCLSTLKMYIADAALIQPLQTKATCVFASAGKLLFFLAIRVVINCVEFDLLAAQVFKH